MKKYLLLSALFSLTLCLSAHEGPKLKTIQHLPLEKVSDNIYVVHGKRGTPGPENRGFMNNPGAIITDEGVIIVDPGSSTEIGEELVAKVKKVTDKPVIAVFNTHVHGDHWLGNEGVLKSYPDAPIYAHQIMIERLKSGEDKVWADMFSTMTEQITANTVPVIPTKGLTGGETVNFGDFELNIYHVDQAHTDNDIMIEVPTDKALFFGDVLNNRGVPHSGAPHDASYKGTINTLSTMLENKDIKIYIPGHGQSGGRDIPEASLEFLQKLYALVEKYYAEGMMDFEMKDKIVAELADYKDWASFDSIGRVISFIYQEVEQDNF